MPQCYRIFGTLLIRDIKALPLPVQTFPLIEDPRWEKEKRQAAQISERLFCALDRNFIEILCRAEDTVLKQTENFIKEINTATTTSGMEREQAVRRSLDGLLACSPKKILASFQKHSLEVGWAYIYTFNRIVDGLADWFPRCRSGIYASRLKYSDVIQVAEEILTTLRACSTLLEDLQRRYDLLEALQANIQADLDDPACERIWRALKNALSDAVKNFGQADDAGMMEKTLKKVAAGLAAPITGTAGIMAATSAQFNEQMTREQRLMVFLKTALMFCEGWGEWRTASKRIVTPNLQILFAMKRDHVRNQVLCICDLVNYNNYPLDGTCARLLTLGALPSIVATWRKHLGPNGMRTFTIQEDGSFTGSDEPSPEWSGGLWKWDQDILIFTYHNGYNGRHAFHGPDKFSELHNDEYWYERMT